MITWPSAQRQLSPLPENLAGVLVVGFDNIGAIKPMLADGQVVATADQHADQLAIFGIEAALKILKGEAPPADQTTAVDLIVK
jgi:ribose transport system substrate-binding protein